MDKYAQSIRYPPFELEHMNPRNIPISKASIDNSDMTVTDFTIGSEDDWFVQWRGAEEEDAEAEILAGVMPRAPRHVDREKDRRRGRVVDAGDEERADRSRDPQ